MKILVIGGTGLIGSQVVAQLKQHGHEVISGSPDTGINTITGEGLAEAMTNTDIVVDLANSPSFKDEDVMAFFQRSGSNLLAAGRRAGVQLHVALSIVGVDVMQNIGYMRAKKTQENLIRQSGIPYTIVRSTQFFEFLKGIADQATVGNEIHLSDVDFQPIAAADVAAFVTQYVLSSPVNGTVEIAGPEHFPLYKIVACYLEHRSDPRKVISDGKPSYYGGEIGHTTLVPAGDAKLGKVDFHKWMAAQLQKA